jgi:hypothetical protein
MADYVITSKPTHFLMCSAGSDKYQSFDSFLTAWNPVYLGIEGKDV